MSCCLVENQLANGADHFSANVKTTENSCIAKENEA